MTTRISTRLLATATLWAAFGGSASAQIPALTAEKALEAKPRQPGVMVTTPPSAAGCKVDPIPNPKTPGANMGYVLRDPAGAPVRQFVSYDNKQFNIVSYFADGVEAYREIDSNLDGVPDQYRWLGPNGSKWGVDSNQDGKIDSWAMISPEEASQELFAALQAKDPARLQALLPTEQELNTLGNPAEIARVKGKMAGAAKRLADTAAKLNLSDKARWLHVQLAAPHVVPADAFGGQADLVTHKFGTVLVEDGKDTHPVQTGEMVLIGRAWKLVEGPNVGPPEVAAGSPGAGDIPDAIKPHIEELDKIDKGLPNPPTAAALAEYNGRRAVVLEQIVGKLPPEKQGPWARQWVESLASAAEGGKPEANPHLDRLKQVRDALAKAGPQNPLAAAAAFKVALVENDLLMKTATSAQIEAVQDKCRANLEEYVKAYPAGEDTPEAMLRLGMMFEHSKDGAAKAKAWYDNLAKAHPQSPTGIKAAGAVKRLGSDGAPFELQGARLADGQPFNVASLAGKVVVVYYWASWASEVNEDAKKLKELVSTYGPKGVELVTVNVDADAKTAAQAVAALQLPGTHLYAEGGLERSPLANGYGIVVVPHTFVVGKDGKVVNRNAQRPMLEEDLKKLAQ